jgi:transcriptional regulator of heat shock response
MADLEAAGLITQPHTSAGRIPTDLGYRYYVDHLMKNRPLTPKEEEIIRENFKKVSNELEEILHQALKALSSLLEYASIIATLGNKVRVYSHGFSHMLKQPEFANLKFTRKIIEVLEKDDLIVDIVKNYTLPHEITIHIGHENYFKEVKELSVVMGSYQVRNYVTGGLGVIGPTRMSYARTISVLRRISQYLGGEKEASTNE